MKKLIALFVAVLMLVAIPLFAGLQNVETEIFPSVVRVTDDQSLKAPAASGTIVHEDGYIITNNHVVEVCGSHIFVQLYDGWWYQAQVISKHTTEDIAILKIDAPYKLQPIKYTLEVNVGEDIYVIGNPLMFEWSVSKGVVSAIRKVRVFGRENWYIQTDAAMNSGNSGGAVVNEKGEYIGVPTMGYMRAQGLNFATPLSSFAKWAIQEIEGHIALVEGLNVILDMYNEE